VRPENTLVPVRPDLQVGPVGAEKLDGYADLPNARPMCIGRSSERGRVRAVATR
jgi:hypothetical protein